MLLTPLKWRRYCKTEDYSNTVELYDAVPKYFASKKRMAEQRQDGRFLNSLKQPFRHKGKDYVVKITPARNESPCSKLRGINPP